MAITVLPVGAGAPRKKTDTFLSTAAWVCPQDVVSVTVTLVSGGGAGGNAPTASGTNAGAGGGGAGGYLTKSFTVVPGTSYTVTIGAGGAAAVGSNVAGNPGNASSFGALFSVIPGQGGGGSSTAPSNGDYACGGRANTANGGGMGQVYGTPVTDLGSQGLLGSPATTGNVNGGINGYCGGGGGGNSGSSTRGKAGGGDGANGASSAATAATANSGSGGGGGATTTTIATYQAGKNGGSGIAFIEYWSAL